MLKNDEFLTDFNFAISFNNCSFSAKENYVSEIAVKGLLLYVPGAKGSADGLF